MIKLILTNTTENRVKVNFLDAEYVLHFKPPNFGLPKGVQIKVESSTFDYPAFLQRINISPVHAFVKCDKLIYCSQRISSDPNGTRHIVSSKSFHIIIEKLMVFSRQLAAKESISLTY